MNKILNVRVGSQLFNIEENAYDSLKNYIKTLHTYFKNDKDSNEILTDLESRMAEIFGGTITKQNKILTQTDIDKMVVMLGKTEDFDLVEVKEGEPKKSVAAILQASQVQNFSQKKLMRDPDDRIIGGVCAGLAHYFNISPIVMRLIVLALFFGAGFGLLIYIALWIIMPIAKSSSDKILMRGLAIDDKSVIGNIKANSEPMEGQTKNSWSGFSHGLSRNIDEKLIGGVSSGLAAKFNIDKVFIRLGFIALTVFNGVGILLYLILWAIMPAANNRLLLSNS